MDGADDGARNVAENNQRLGLRCGWNGAGVGLRMRLVMGLEIGGVEARMGLGMGRGMGFKGC